jgi:hypothetical protein
MTKRITNGTRQVLINANTDAGPFNARLWVNVSATDMGDATLVARTFKTLAGAEKWAAAELAK